MDLNKYLLVFLLLVVQMWQYKSFISYTYQNGEFTIIQALNSVGNEDI